MTTLAKIEANQRNGQLSTGPRTLEGKAIVARNATKHGIFAAVPVLPGESADEWQVHRAGVIESLAPIGLLELNLAERAALLLWRLQRLARYEAETVAAAMEDVEVPAFLPSQDPASTQREDQLRAIRGELLTARRELAEASAARDYFASELTTAAPFAIAEYILGTACVRAEAADDLRTDPPAFGSKSFMRKLGLPGTNPQTAPWTPELIRCALALYARFTREPVELFAEHVRAELESRAEELGRKGQRLEREATAVARFLDGRSDRSRSARLLPANGCDERIAKYERHLHGLLTSTLHELERLQARREGANVPPPAAAEVNLVLNTVSE
ncbi:Uncharacterized protein OS=Rubrobacter xylanophilus (strain DSM 9941 / NBRC 16129) GN=Rxyl_1596 PE=4 SV=1 [Gemmata massiliana]|uniref:Uncharacterized protein n=1 Tax=Gemmata massiliana TaxID=1210884 RepID=A0A6P2DJL5_9BACT|nr:hypothetical protein [Gemmata massiliana]VTS01840.1 Uncharacterized protein OS=Rubrobacter xylanophilus (strain DSM 9941 / NBRC 16129) GN=Rxyl_1596 PE=4 SV=1 [Gemmata massiliana]